MTDRWVEQHNEAIPAPAEDRLQAWEVCYELGYHSSTGWDPICEVCGGFYPVKLPDLGEKHYKLWWVQETTGRVVQSGCLTLEAAQGILESPVGIRLNMALVDLR
jgi:hypothetical protein